MLTVLVAGAGLLGAAAGPAVRRAADRLAGDKQPDRTLQSPLGPGAAGGSSAALEGPGTAPAGVLVRRDRQTVQGRSRAVLVSLGLGGLCAGLAWRFGADPVLPAVLYLAGLSVLLTDVDVRVHRLPDAVTLPSYPVVLALLAVAALCGSDSGSLLRAVLGGAAGYGGWLLLRAATRGVGFGDVKLAGVLGLYAGWLGWGAWLVATFTGVLYAGTTGAVLLLLGRVGRRARLPMGPFLLAGTLKAVLGGHGLVDAYLQV